MAKMVLITTNQLKMLDEKRKHKKDGSAMSQVGGKVNSGIMFNMMAGGLCEESKKGAAIDAKRYKACLKNVFDFMVDKGYVKYPYPKVVLNTHYYGNGLLIKTAFYDPEHKTIHLFVSGALLKDRIRSFCHEVIHYSQDQEGRLGNGAYSGDKITEDDKLIKLEKEAYLKGNIAFRSWTETLQHEMANGKTFSFVNESQLLNGATMINEELDMSSKDVEERLRAAVRDKIKQNTLRDGAEMAEHHVNILKDTFGDDAPDVVDDDFNLLSAVIDNEYEKCGYKHDLSGVKSHEESEKKSLEQLHDMQSDSIDEEVKPSEISLKSFNIKKNLNPKFWKDGRLDSRIRLRLLDIADAFIDYLGIDWVKPDDIVMTGSLANYNWNEKYSDIDLHVMMDYSLIDENETLVDNYLYSLKELWNNEHGGIKIFGFPVECFVENSNSGGGSESGIYSLEKDEWVEKPNKKHFTEYDVDKKSIRRKVAAYVNAIERVEERFADVDGDEYEQRKLYKDVCTLWSKIKSERKDGFAKSSNEMNTGNLVFKSLRRRGCVEKVQDIKTKLYDKLKSLP